MAALVQLGELQLVHGDMVARQALAPAPAPAVGFQGKWSLNRVHCSAEDCPWRMHTSKMRNSTNVQVKVNPFKHTCLESTLRKETMSRANSRWVAEEVKRRVIKNHQVGTKELQKKLKEKFKIEVLPALEGKQQWDIVDPGFKLCPSVLKREAGRPRKSRIWPHGEGAGLGPRRRKCTRCGGSGNFSKFRDNAVDPAFVECFDEENEEQNDVFDTDPNNDPIEAPNDEKIDDENDDQIEDPIEAHIDDQNDDQIEAPNDEEKNDQNDDPNVVSNLLWFSVVGSNKVVAVSSEIVKVSTTKRKIEEAVSTRGTKSEVVAMSTMITRSKVVAMSTRITRSTMAKKIHE
ncbi:hypothetical protein ACQ4PT_035850 [Festuca glaucescens]